VPAIEACRRVGPEGRVVALDISREALQEAGRVASESSGRATLEPVMATATVLPFADSSFDVVLTRSVLIYIDDKAAAVREFFRVLRPGGRVSIFEPINRAAMQYGDYGGGRDLSSVQPAHDRIVAYAWAKWAHRAAMTDFDERDLVSWFVESGFDVQLTYEYTEARGPALSERQQARRRAPAAAALARRYNPTLPSYAEAAEAVLGETAPEHLRRLVEIMLSRPGWGAIGYAYLVARRPKE
jgi:SAM-dependent methyltransferase